MEKKTTKELLAMSDTQVRAYLFLLSDAERKVADKELLRATAANTVQVLVENRKRRSR
jgi:hypothetical protein